MVDFDPFLFVSLFQGSLAVTMIMIDGSEKPNRQLGFEFQSCHVIENRNKQVCFAFKFILVPQREKRGQSFSLKK